jgi:hypothetical protein
MFLETTRIHRFGEVTETQSSSVVTTATGHRQAVMPTPRLGSPTKAPRRMSSEFSLASLAVVLVSARFAPSDAFLAPCPLSPPCRTRAVSVLQHPISTAFKASASPSWPHHGATRVYTYSSPGFPARIRWTALHLSASMLEAEPSGEPTGPRIWDAAVVQTLEEGLALNELEHTAECAHLQNGALRQVSLRTGPLARAGGSSPNRGPRNPGD